MITVRITNDEMSAKLQKIIEAGKDLRPVLTNIAGMMKDAAEQNFAAQGQNLNPKWDQLKSGTLRQKKKKGYSTRILERTGWLAGSIQASADDTRAVAGTNVPYAQIHQFGGDINMPARPLLFRKYSKGKKKGRTLFANARNAQFGQMGKPYTIHIPPRPFLALTEENQQAMVKRLGDYLIGD